MAIVERVELLGNQMLVTTKNGNTEIAYPTGRSIWVGGNVDGDGGGGEDGDISTGDVPDSLSAKDTEGSTYNLNKTQLTHARDIINAASRVNGVTRDVLVIVLITALVESVLYMYANTAVYPESGSIPHDRDHSDADSVGLFQQRPSIGWGSVSECMDTGYSTRAFLGGQDGPNGGSPPGLFDLSNWQGDATPGRSAQRVQGSAFPARYDVVVPVAKAIIDALVTSGGASDDGTWQWPFKYSEYVLSIPEAQYGVRVHPITGVKKMHYGLDFGAGGIAGKPIPCASDGKVVEANFNSAMGNHVIVDHPGGFRTRYFHMVTTPSVSAGQSVTKGQTLGNVGSTGLSNGPHLHWETLTNGEWNNPRDFMKARGVPES